MIVAWGAGITKPHGIQRIQEVLHLLREQDSYCLERTVDGKYPEHPLFLRGDLVPIVFQKAIEK